MRRKPSELLTALVNSIDINWAAALTRCLPTSETIWGDGNDAPPLEKDDSARLKTYDTRKRKSRGMDLGHAPLPGDCEESPSSENDSSSEDEEDLDSDESFGVEDASGGEESCSDEGEDDELISEDEDVIAEDDGDSDGILGKRKSSKKHVCAECGFKVSKPALLTQHMRSHSEQNGNSSYPDAAIQALQHRITSRTPQLRALGQTSTRRSFACPESGCSCSYKRQDHLNRHMKKHNGVSFPCTHPGCEQTFTIQGNLRRHLQQHEENPEFPLAKSKAAKTYICKARDCGKVFRYPSLLKTHEENVHEKFRYAELYCIYPGCGDKFSKPKALLQHANTAHPYLLCEVCGEHIARKSFMRHVRRHAMREPCDVVCPYDECGKSYTRETNLRQHIRSVHLQLKPFTCSIDGCGQRFAHKASQERHEASKRHAPPRHDFEEQDRLFLERPRGGRRPFSFDGRGAQELLGQH